MDVGKVKQWVYETMGLRVSHAPTVCYRNYSEKRMSHIHVHVAHTFPK